MVCLLADRDFPSIILDAELQKKKENRRKKKKKKRKKKPQFCWGLLEFTKSRYQEKEFPTVQQWAAG